GNAPETISGPRVRAGFSDPPEMGNARNTAVPIHNPMASPAGIAPPGARWYTAVDMTTISSTAVSTNSVNSAAIRDTPGPGRVVPRSSSEPSLSPYIAQLTRAA